MVHDDNAPASLTAARSPGRSWNELAENDSRTVPDFMVSSDERYLGSAPLGVERYTSKAFFDLEMEKMWPNVWQFAARDEDFPEPGDTVVYENAGRSYVLIRQEDLSVRAFHNVCLHRGRLLKSKGGRARELRCSYHAWAWNLDGTIKDIPCRWDFGHLNDEDLKLPEAQVGSWAGYVFVKDNEGGESLEEFLAPVPEHFQRWDHANRVTATWVAKIVHCNWKACSEAFMEAYHVIATHPQVMPFTGDTTTKYSILSDHVNFLATPMGVTSSHIGEHKRGEQWVMDQYLKYNNRVVPTGTVVPPVADGKSARAAMGDFQRQRLAEMTGRDHNHASDAEVQDALIYNVFPNFAPWTGFQPNIVYRWRPHEDQHHCLMDVRILRPLAQDEPRPPRIEMTMIEDGGSWETHLGTLGAILEQDMSNLLPLQNGMRRSKNGLLHLGNHQESRIRHFHQTMDKYLAR